MSADGSSAPAPAPHGTSPVRGGVFVGVDIGGTKVAALCDDGRDVSEYWQEHAVSSSSGDDPLDAIVTAVHAVTPGDRAPDAVGVSVAGWFTRDRSELLEAANLGLRNRRLAAELAERLDCPVVVENDGNATALAEARAGAGRDARSLAVFALGTGVGGGLVVDGQLLVGSHGLGGELGHLSIASTDERCVCGGTGCLELYASGTAIARRAGTGNLRQVIDAADRGSAAASAAIDGAAEAIGTAIDALIPVIDPDLVLLAGSVALALGDRLLDRVESRLGRTHALSAVTTAPPVRFGSLGATAATVGALELARSRHILEHERKEAAHHGGR